MDFSFEKFYNMTPMKYYDCGGKYESFSAQQMIQNENNGFIATQKSDGEWCRIIIDDGRIVAQSRNISKKTGEYGDKTEHIPHIIEEASWFGNGTVLLGELCFPAISSTAKEVGTILRCLPQKAVARQKSNPLMFKVFDCLAYNGKDLSDEPYETRFITAHAIIDKINDERGLQYISLCNYTESNFEDFLADILRRGGEGIVIHSKNYKYAPGKRPAWSTLKVKKTTGEIEALVLNTIAPKKHYEGKELSTWQYFVDGEPVTKPYFMGWENGIVVDVNGNNVNVTSGLTDEDREWLSTEAAKDMITNGELWAAISGMEITEDSVRHPRLIRLRTEK